MNVRRMGVLLAIVAVAVAAGMFLVKQAARSGGAAPAEAAAPARPGWGAIRVYGHYCRAAGRAGGWNEIRN